MHLRRTKAAGYASDAEEVAAFAAEGRAYTDGDSSFLERLHQLNMIRDEHERMAVYHKMEAVKAQRDILKLVDSHSAAEKEPDLKPNGR